MRAVVVLPAVGVGGADAGVRAVVGEAAVRLLAEVVELGGAGDGVDAGAGTEDGGRGAADRVGLPAGRDAEPAAERRGDVDLRVDDGDPLVVASTARGRTSGASTASVGSSARAGGAEPRQRQRQVTTIWRRAGASVATAPSARRAAAADGALPVLEDVLLGGLLLRIGVELHDPIGQQLALVRLAPSTSRPRTAPPESPATARARPAPGAEPRASPASRNRR